MTLLRRYLVLLALLFWQGGFTFYSSVVVHVGQQVLGSHLAQGLVTRSVTNYLNLAGIVAIVMLAWDLLARRDASTIRRVACWGLSAVLPLTLALLAWLHVLLDDLIDVTTGSIADHSGFHALHSWYLHVSTIQWVASLTLIAVTLWSWRSADLPPDP